MLLQRYLHEQKIVHRDIKTRNIFLFKRFPILKIGDFGISTSLSERLMASTAIGTPYYLSPEICSGMKYDYKSDMWALGCVLYEMATGNHPFDAGNLKVLMSKILKGEFKRKDIMHLSSNLQTMICKLLSYDPEARPTAKVS